MGGLITQTGGLITQTGGLITELGGLITDDEIEMTVVKSNDLIRKSRYELSLQEYKLILYFISKIRPGDEDFREYDYDLRSICEITGAKPCGQNYKQLRASLKSLADRSFWVRIGDADVLCRWISKVRIYPGEAKISVRLDDDLKPYLLRLKNNFTIYGLENALGMRSRYSIRLYELLHSYVNLSSASFPVDELKRLLDAENYTLFKDFRSKVIEYAVNEINELTELSVSVSYAKSGRQIGSVMFEIRYKSSAERAGAIRELGKRGIIK